MARQPRFFVPGVPQHAVQRGCDRRPIVEDEEDRCFFIGCLAEASHVHRLQIHAYVLMTNHLHLLATPQDCTSLPRTFQDIGRRYVPYFNRKYGRTGALWESRYRAAVVETERYFLTCMKYIELNPVRAGLVRYPDEFQWSSYRSNALGMGDGVVSPHEVYERLGQSAAERTSRYRELFDSAVPPEEIAAVRTATNNNWALGGKDFLRFIEEATSRRAMPLF
jgi:putative transposase